MDAPTSLGIPRAFQSLADPRRANHTHRLIDILTLALVAVLGGAEDWVNVAVYARSKQAWLKTFLDLPTVIPSHDTFNRLFARLDPDAFEACFRQWTATLADLSGGKLVALDGKTLRSSFAHAWDQSGPGAPGVSAFVQANHLVFAQEKTDGKGQELSAIKKLLQVLDLTGAVVTIDALGCQKEVAQLIVDAKADYLLQVKDNQPTLKAQLATLFGEAALEKYQGWTHATCTTVDGDHGRLETREAHVLWDVQHLGALAGEWAGLRSVALIRRTRDLIGADGRRQVRTENHYYISSFNRRRKAETFLACSRGHWSVENNLHWQLDVSFHEDQRRLHKGHGAENFSRLNRIALTLLKKETTRKVGIATKRNLCGWDNDYLLKVLAG
ncbi:MAG TPA: ISAs1 family transposase [Polyangia bacterium]